MRTRPLRSAKRRGALALLQRCLACAPAARDRVRCIPALRRARSLRRSSGRQGARALRLRRSPFLSRRAAAAPRASADNSGGEKSIGLSGRVAPLKDGKARGGKAQTRDLPVLTRHGASSRAGSFRPGPFRNSGRHASAKPLRHRFRTPWQVPPNLAIAARLLARADQRSIKTSILPLQAPTTRCAERRLGRAGLDFS